MKYKVLTRGLCLHNGSFAREMAAISRGIAGQDNLEIKSCEFWGWLKSGKKRRRKRRKGRETRGGDRDRASLSSND